MSIREPQEEEQPLAPMDRAWANLQAAVAAQVAIAQTNDGVCIGVGLNLIRRRAHSFLRAVDDLLDLTAE